MPKGPKNPDDVLPEVLEDLKRIFKDDLISATLHGSAAGGEYRPGLSDLNLLVVVTPAGLAALDRLAPYYKLWWKKRISPPLVLSPEELESSLDSFPLEFLNMKLRHQTFHGPDPLAGLAIDPADLRLQCERELRGKLFLLREAVISSAGREDELRLTALDSIKAFIAIFRGVLFLLGEDPAGASADQVLQKAAARLGLKDAQVFSALWGLREAGRPAKGQTQELVRRYLRAVAEAAQKVDGLPAKS